ncbi:M23 family metallopeptidase [Streptomyces arenae]|uniref:M23 family metallopeptidase n=1 Tax=Streptomyces arenae TaxID=29301 RepID=UPI00265ABF11|nr:M23 family metallopeptidase [Streptomyces arenae]MCG7206323.1 M23 family metallopeptidase [Streptomyces arenae]
MNDRHPSGTLTTPAPGSDAGPAHYASYGTQEAQYGEFTTYGDQSATGAPFHNDPLFGSLPGQSQATGTYDATQWQTVGDQTLNYDAYAAQHHAAYDSGAYDNTAWAVPAQGTQGAVADTSGHWDANAWLQPDQSAMAGATQQWEWGTQAFDTGAYDATQWNSDGTPAQAAEPEHEPQATGSFEQLPYEEAPYESYEESPYEESPYEEGPYKEGSYEEGSYEEVPAAEGELSATGELPAVTPLLEDQEEVTPAPSATRAGSRAGARSRRRTPPKRSALLTIAVPSACVMGVAGIAAASVGSLTDDGKDTTASASDAQSVKPSAANSKLDAQLRTLSAGADDFADRASRTQERIDLKAQQEAEKKKAAAEAARKERLRPKYVLPVTQRGLSAYFGQAGVNWMSVHTGIDFPVSYGTTVMAATDGVVSTKWNSAYGNMLIVTAKDGTETWYCHLSSYRVASGTTVKAGDPVAYSGNSGNSTGPHLHFEVRPAGGAAIDPLPWLRSHGLDPT